MKTALKITGILAAIILVLWLTDWDWVAILQAFGQLVIIAIIGLLCWLSFGEGREEIDGDIF